MCRNETAGCVEMKLKNVSKWNCRMCRNETAGCVEMKLQNVLKWNCRMCRNETAGCVDMKHVVLHFCQHRLPGFSPIHPGTISRFSRGVCGLKSPLLMTLAHLLELINSFTNHTHLKTLQRPWSIYWF